MTKGQFKVLVLIICFTSFKIIASPWDIDIEDDCQPDGIISSMKLKYDPVGFWVKQAVELEAAIEWLAYDLSISRCPKNTFNRKGCIEELQMKRSWLNRVKYCHKYAEKQYKILQQTQRNN